MAEPVLNDPLLTPNEKRFVMFPIQDDSIWQMYKKQVDSFWVPQEVGLSQDLADWKKLSDDERHFISMVLAFFAGSDGIVQDNLAARFMGDVQLSEARAFMDFRLRWNPYIMKCIVF